jgi:hypothetical protein
VAPCILVLSEASFRVHHTSGKQSYGRKVLGVERELQYDNICFCYMLKIEYSNFLIDHHRTGRRNDNAHIFGSRLVRISAETPTILTEVFVVFLSLPRQIPD